MALFRYRYVDIGTVFRADPRQRAADDPDSSPATLFANELACGVGDACWGTNQPLAVLDPHPRHKADRSASSAAFLVLQAAQLIAEKFAHSGEVVWLVSHTQPDFDAFYSMYLARWIISEAGRNFDWTRYGLFPDEWDGLDYRASSSRVVFELSDVPPDYRWPLLLAGYASLLESRRPIACPLERDLRAVLLAALKRGRDYLSVDSGATEFFDEVRTAIERKQLNPAFDSVLEGSATFAPELAMLDREIAAYRRDLSRARMAVVYLPEAEAPTADFFEDRKKATASEANAENLSLADTFRIPTDAIYLRDPECALFTEWARTDVQRSSLGRGFEFTATAYSNRIAAASGNMTDYVFAIDPNRAEGRHLFTVWSLLETREVEAHRIRAEASPDVLHERGSVEVEAVLADPWLGGQSQSSTLVESPRRGTLIGPAGTRGDLLDDPVAQAVRAELEHVLFAAKSLLAGPQVAIADLAATEAADDIERCYFDLNTPANLPAPDPGQFRFAGLRLRSDVPITVSGVLARQIAEVLWQALHPDLPGVPYHELENLAVVTADSVGIWSERGVAVARKGVPPPTELELVASDPLAETFSAVAALSRDIDRLTSAWIESESGATSRERSRINAQQLATEGEEVARRALELQQTLTLPEHALVRKFADHIGLEKMMVALHDFNANVTEHLRQESATEDAHRQEKRAEDIARLQQKMKWLEVALVGFMALQLAGTVLRNVSLEPDTKQLIALFTGPLAALLAALLLPSPKLTRAVPRESSTGFRWVLLGALFVFLMFWAAQLYRTW
jgi:hypothetical protein